jgi:hypothetical protein
MTSKDSHEESNERKKVFDLRLDELSNVRCVFSNIFLENIIIYGGTLVFFKGAEVPKSE